MRSPAVFRALSEFTIFEAKLGPTGGYHRNLWDSTIHGSTKLVWHSRPRLCARSAEGLSGEINVCVTMSTSKYVCTVSVSPEGVKVRLSGTEGLFRKKRLERMLNFAWNEVTRVSAFKRDCFAIDLICFEFELNGTRVTEINEDAVGWDSLVSALPTYLPGALSQNEWWSDVVQPPFELC